MKVRESIKDILKDKHMRLTLIPLLFSTVFMIGGTFAWFNFFSDVNNTLTGHVVGWNISFEGDDVIDSEYTITIDKIFPGMDDFSSPISITNSGEATAEISYRIKSIEVFGNKVSVGDTVDDVLLGNEEFEQYFSDHYPFSLSYSIGSRIIAPSESTNFTVGMVWPYETYKKVTESSVFEADREYYFLSDDGEYELATISADNFEENIEDLYQLNDKEDTYWGEESITYSESSPDEPSVKIVIEISAAQVIE